MPTHSVLIVEDERIVARDIRAMLVGCGYSVPAIVSSGSDAIREVATHRPDLVLMDIRLDGDLDGIAAAESIRGRFDTPVIYLTAYADDATRARARRTAPYGYVIKPFDERTLQSTVEMALERHARDREVKAGEQWLLMTLNSIGDAVLTTDARGLISFMNPTAEQLLRRSAAEVKGMAVDEAAPLLDAETHLPIAHPVLLALRGTPGPLLYDAILVMHDGAETFIHVTAAPIRTAPEAIQGAVIVLQDSSARRQAEQARLDKQRMAAEARQIERLHVLSSGIAHDVNNMLTAIIGNVELALASLDGNSPAREYLNSVPMITRRAANLTRQLLAYAGNVAIQKEPIDLNELVSDIVALYTGSALGRAEIRANLAADLPRIEADPTQLRNVVHNLCVNAAEAIGSEAGTITITTSTRQLTRADLAAATAGSNLPPGRYVAVEIADTGPGMDAATLARIFEPFFSTKFVGRGLGLAAVLGIVGMHRGAVAVQSALGRGTTFSIFLLPMTADRPSAAQGAHGRASSHSTLLLVDDEATMRAIGSRLLRLLGHTALEAADGHAALEIFRDSGAGIDCVLLDLTMPGMSGAEVARAIRQIDPAMPIIVMSGYSKEHIAAAVADVAELGFLPKPFQLEDLRAQLDQLLVARRR